jgi:hypothetical protein
MKVFRWLSCLSILFIIASFSALMYWFLDPHYPPYVVQRQAVFNDRKVSFFIVDLTKGGYRFELRNDEEGPKTVKSWREALGSDIVFNAAYFGEDDEPVGYLNTGMDASGVPWPSEETQRQQASYSFLTSVNGGRIDLRYLKEEPLTQAAGNAFLSFPTLLYNGEVLIKEDSLQYSSRTLLAEASNGHTYLIVTKSGTVSLFEAANWLKDQPEKFTVAGNLDGGPSTGLSLENGQFDIEDPSDFVPSVIAGFATQ